MRPGEYDKCRLPLHPGSVRLREAVSRYSPALLSQAWNSDYIYMDPRKMEKSLVELASPTQKAWI